MNKFPIKTERDVERRLEIKTERQSPFQSVQAKQKHSPAVWQEEKKTLINKIVAMKAENQQNLLALKKVQADYNFLLVSKQKLVETVTKNEESFFVQLKEIKLELSNAKNEIVNLKLSSEQTISELKRDKEVLGARVRQFQTGIQHKSNFESHNNKFDSTDSEFEVEQIIKHRYWKNSRQYLIRWKGYDSSDDTWENERNLNCPKILNEYNKSIGFN